MSLTTITVTGSYPAGAGSSVAQGYVTFAPTARVVNAAGHEIIPQIPVQVQLQLGAFSLPNVVTTDNAGLAPSGWAWQVTENINGIAADPYYVFIPSSYGETVDLAQLTEATPGPIVTAYANLAAANTFTETNTFSDGITVAGAFELDGTEIASPPGGTTEYLRADGTWDVPPGGAVTSVNSQTGAVVLNAGNVGADAAGAASTAQANAETFATNAASTAQTNAETFATSAVATETARAEAAEATKLTAADNLSDVPNAGAARANLGIVAAAVSVAGIVTPPGGTTTFLRADGTWAAPPGGTSTAYSRQLLIAADGPGSTVTPPVGTWTPTYLMTSDTGGVWSGWVNVSDGAQNDSISFDLAAGAGTYGFELRHLAYNNRGIYTVQIDGVNVGTIDGYAASLTAARGILTGITISSGTHVITLLMATQNASATGFFGLIERILLTRTA